MFFFSYRGADKPLVQPGRKQATATFASHSKKNSEGCPSNQVSAAAMTSTSDEKWRPLNCFFIRVGLRTYQHPCTERLRSRTWNTAVKTPPFCNLLARAWYGWSIWAETCSLPLAEYNAVMTVWNIQLYLIMLWACATLNNAASVYHVTHGHKYRLHPDSG